MRIELSFVFIMNPLFVLVSNFYTLRAFIRERPYA